MNQENNRSDSSKEEVEKRGTLFGLHKVKRFLNLHRMDGALSSQDENCKSGTDSDCWKGFL
jgi:hypothetical protein